MSTENEMPSFSDFDKKPGEPSEPPAPPEAAEEKQPDIKNEVVTRQAAIDLNAEGGVAVKTLEEQFRFATALYKSGTLPRSFDSANKVLAGLQLCAELGLKPMTGLRQMVMINNMLHVWGELPLSLVRRSGLLQSITEYCVDKDGKIVTAENQGQEIFGAVCKTVRRGAESQPYVTWFNKDDVDKAKLMKKDTYQLYFRRMIQMRARSQNLKDNFADVLIGIGIAEYDHNATVSPTGNLVGGQKDVTDTAGDLNKEFGVEEKEAASV